MTYYYFYHAQLNSFTSDTAQFNCAYNDHTMRYYENITIAIISKSHGIKKNEHFLDNRTSHRAVME